LSAVATLPIISDEPVGVPVTVQGFYEIPLGHQISLTTQNDENS